LFPLNIYIKEEEVYKSDTLSIKIIMYESLPCAGIIQFKFDG